MPCSVYYNLLSLLFLGARLKTPGPQYYSIHFHISFRAPKHNYPVTNIVAEPYYHCPQGQDIIKVRHRA